MNNKIKVYVVGGAINYANFLLMDYELVNSISKSDLVIFTGGEDVYPLFYGENTGSNTYYNEQRDYIETDEFELARKYNVLIVGICRGAQFCTVRSGGRLIQHVENHAIRDTHKIFIKDECREIDITSTHHQMMYPFILNSDDYKIIAHTKSNLSKIYLNGSDRNINLPENFVEPEIVYYYKTNCLCIQGHPEYMDKSSQAVKFINSLVEDLLEDNIKNIVEEVDEVERKVQFVDNLRIHVPRVVNFKLMNYNEYMNMVYPIVADDDDNDDDVLN